MTNKYDRIIGDHLLISNYVRYETLTNLINKEFYNSNYEEITLCIDAYSMIKSIYGLNPSQFIDRYSIASCIINACAHYRNFFWTRYKVTCKIFIVFSRMEESIRESRQFYPEYGNIFTNENNHDMDLMIEENMYILKLLCPYIPDVQFVYSKYEPMVVFGKIAVASGANKNTRNPTIIVSKDPMILQNVANDPMVYMLRPVKQNGNDLSVLISNNTVMDYYLTLRKVKEYVPIHPSYLSFIISATRFPERGLKSLHNISSIIKYLYNAISQNYINQKGVYDIEGLCKDLEAFNKVKLKLFNIALRMNAIGYNNCMLRYMITPQIDNLDMINLIDPNSVKQINERYFSKVPLDLMSL